MRGTEHAMSDLAVQHVGSTAVGRHVRGHHPTNNATLINFRLSSDAKNFVNKHRLSIQIGARRAKTCVQCVHIPTELPLCIPPLVVGQVLGTCPNKVSVLYVVGSETDVPYHTFDAPDVVADVLVQPVGVELLRVEVLQVLLEDLVRRAVGLA